MPTFIKSESEPVRHPPTPGYPVAPDHAGADVVVGPETSAEFSIAGCLARLGRVPGGFALPRPQLQVAVKLLLLEAFDQMRLAFAIAKRHLLFELRSTIGLHTHWRMTESDR